MFLDSKNGTKKVLLKALQTTFPNTLYKTQMSYHVFSQKFVPQDCSNGCKKNLYWEWEYSVPPTWLTNKISKENLKKEINTINDVSVDETPKLSCSPCMVYIICMFIGGLIAGLPQTINCYNREWTNPCSDSVRTFKYVSMGVGIVIVICGISVMGCLGNKRLQNANIGREKALEYISTLNDKYKDKDISFATYKRNITQVTQNSDGAASTLHWELIDIVVSSGNNNIIGIIVPVTESLDAPLLSDNNEGNNTYKSTELGTVNFCSNCGSNAKGMNFCKKCGNKV